MTLTFVHDLEKVKINQWAKCLVERSLSSKVIVRARRHTHLYSAQCSIWTTTVIANKSHLTEMIF